jgi:polysaccharide biosynthesis protein PelE
MQLSRLLAHGLPLALDAGACVLVVAGHALAGGAVHVLATAAAFGITRRWVGGDGGVSAAATAALLVAFLPAVGTAILAFVAWPSLLRERTAARAAIVEVPLPEDGELGAERPLFAASTPTRSIRQVLRDAGPVEERVHAVMALRHMDARHAVPLLRQAFAHESEDVRLLAFAILERREKRLRGRIKTAESRLARAGAGPSERPARWHRRLGRDHWELVYGGFVSGDLEPIVLDKARQHLECALELELDTELMRLLARIHLRQRAPERARPWLDRAERAGAPRATLAPWLAEAAWQERRFGEVAAILRSVPRTALRRPELDAVAAFWTEGGAEP